MPKFIKEQIEKAKQLKRGTESAFKLKAMMKGKQGLYTFYSIWFSCIKAFIKGNPSWTMKQAWKVYVIPFVPNDWTCTDKGFEGVKARRRCILIQHQLNKELVVTPKNKRWLKKELLPAFEKDFRDKELDFDKLGEMPEEKIQKQVEKLKNEKRFEAMLK